MGYNFFTYKGNMPEGFTPAFFSIPHFVFLGIVFVVLPLIFFLIRKKAKRENIDLFLKILSVIVLTLEIADITWESYYQINSPAGFDFAGEMPLYTCSIFIYALLVHAWGKGRAKECSLSFLTTVGLVCGAIGVVYCNGINNYPFWTLGAFYSLYFHSAMFEIGLLLLITGYKKLEWKDVFRSWMPILLMAIIATPVNYVYGADYMQTYAAYGVPLFSKLAEILAGLNLRPLFTIFYLLVYLPMAAVVICVAKLIYLIGGKGKKKPEDPEGVETEQKEIEVQTAEQIEQPEGEQPADIKPSA